MFLQEENTSTSFILQSKYQMPGRYGNTPQEIRAAKEAAEKALAQATEDSRRLSASLAKPTTYGTFNMGTRKGARRRSQRRKTRRRRR